MQHIVPVVDAALKSAGISKGDISAVAFTQSPGLIGSLMVGASFAKAYAQALGVPLIAVHHMQAHVLAHFIEDPKPEFPFLCLTVSGGHTQLVLCRSHLKMDILGETIDDAAGEAFDKCAKMLGLPYPGGPMVDKLAREGDPKKFTFPVTKLAGLQYSFSGVKTAVMYFLQKQKAVSPTFIEDNLADLCASIQHTIILMLMSKLVEAAAQCGATHVGIAGGVSANSGLRKALEEEGLRQGWQVYIPKFEYCTDNAAMIGMAGHYKYLAGQFAELSVVPSPRSSWG
jgi:N6-L-threonylcarbamoyladenine synthase